MLEAVSVAGSYRLRVSLLIAALGFVYVAGNGRVPLFDRDEPRFALTSRAMLQSGDWVVPRLMDEVRTAKPPAIYWLQAAAMRLLGFDEFAVRLPGALACAATLVLLACTLPPLVGRRRAAWTCFTIGTCVLVLGVAKVGVIDAVLLLCTAAMQVALLRLLLRQGRPISSAIMLWCAVGFAGLLKGPVIAGVLLMTLLAWRLLARFGTARNLRPSGIRSDSAASLPKLHIGWGVFIVTLICGPWIVLVSLREPGFITTALSHDVAARSVRGLEGHGQPPGFHLLALLGTWFPWSVILPATLLAAWRRRHVPRIGFALAATVGPWLMFELIVTKLPHYLLVTFPMLALLTADWIVRALRRLRTRRQAPFEMKVAAPIYATVALCFAAAPYILGAPSSLGSAVAVLWAAALLLTWMRRLLQAALLTAGAGMAMVVLVAYLAWLGRVPLITVSPRTAEALHAAGAREAAMVHYREPSLAWYAQLRGIRVREAEEFEVLAHRFVVTTRHQWHAVSKEARSVWVVEASIPSKLYNERLVSTEVLVVRRALHSEELPTTTN